MPALAEPRSIVQLLLANPYSDSFVDDSSSSKHRSGESVYLEDDTCVVLYAKDKDTMRRGLAYAGEQFVHVENGSLYILYGHYSGEFAALGARLKRAVVRATPSVMHAMKVNIKTTGKGYGAMERAEAANFKARNELRTHGYYLVLAAQTPVSAQPAAGRVYALHRRRATWNQIATLMNGGVAAGQVTPSFRLDKETVYQRFVSFCKTGARKTRRTRSAEPIGRILSMV